MLVRGASTLLGVALIHGVTVSSFSANVRVSHDDAGASERAPKGARRGDATDRGRFARPRPAWVTRPRREGGHAGRASYSSAGQRRALPDEPGVPLDAIARGAAPKSRRASLAHERARKTVQLRARGTTGVDRHAISHGGGRARWTCLGDSAAPAATGLELAGPPVAAAITGRAAIGRALVGTHAAGGALPLSVEALDRRGPGVRDLAGRNASRVRKRPGAGNNFAVRRSRRGGSAHPGRVARHPPSCTSRRSAALVQSQLRTGGARGATAQRSEQSRQPHRQSRRAFGTVARH